MPLTKRISKIFKNSEKNGANLPRYDGAPLSTLSSVFEAEDERDIASATQASLQEEVTRLENRVRRQTDQLAVQEETTSQNLREIDYLSRVLASRGNQHLSEVDELRNTYSAQLSARDVTLRELSRELQSAQEAKDRGSDEVKRLKDENSCLRNDVRALHELHQEYAAWVPQAEAYRNEQERKIQDLDQRLSLALQPMDDTTRHAYLTGVETSREKRQLEAQLEAQKIDMQEQIRILSDERHSSVERNDRERSEWEARIVSMETALQEQRVEHDAILSIIQSLEMHQINLQEEADKARMELEDAKLQRANLQARLHDLFGPQPTPRQLLLVKLFVSKFPRLRQNQATSSSFAQGHSVEDLTIEDLDVPLHDNGLMAFVNSISPGSPGHPALQRSQFRRCPECKRHKIFCPRIGGTAGLTEYPHFYRQEKCRTCPLCTECLREKLRKAIVSDWWYELDSTDWLKCPVEGCRRPLEIPSIASLGVIFRDFTSAEANVLTSTYRRALALREALTQIDPKPSPEAMSVSIGLHQQLLAFGITQGMPDVSAADAVPLADTFEAGEILMGEVERLDSKIPIFVSLFWRSDVAKDCTICLESFHDIRIESQERWMQACEGYQGRWMSDLLPFPTSETLRCEHEMNVCKSCIKQHLESQLESHGRSAQGRLTCPLCNRALSQAELNCLASVETVQKYDHYLFLSYLSSDPNFRSCLSPTCNSGRIYEQDDYPDPHICCEECDFEMCFTHQIPWHAGLSCDQYDSQREHGDPEFLGTQEWMRTHSKPCPGCRANIEKGNACFHMTCTQCRHEFCWECLGDWGQINPRPGEYVKEAHNNGCWFRANDLEPTQISGTELQEALRRRRR